MDEYSSKRAIDGLVVSRKGSGLVLRDAANNRDQNVQFCNRVGCSGRLNSMKSTQMCSSEKAKSSRPSFRSASSGKEIVGSSSRTSSSISNPRKSFMEPRKKVSCLLETDSSETSSVQDEPEISELSPPSRTVQGGLCPESRDVESSKDAMMEVGSLSVVSNTRSRRNMNQKSGFGTRDTSTSSTSLASKNSGQATRTIPSRYGLRNLRCNSVSDVIPSGCSTSDSSLSRRKDVPKKRNCEGESSSSARRKKLSGPTSEGRSSSSSHGVSISDSRRVRNCPPTRDNIVGSVRTRRSATGYTRARLSNQENGNSSSPNESPVAPHIPQPELPIDLSSSPSHQFSGETPFNRQNSCSRPGSSSGSLRGIIPTSPTGVGITRSLMNREGFRHCNMDGIAEVLLALERIEQDEELTYEQLLVLETNFFLSGLNFYDQHREMRLDIDNMSYEELLALEERMGSVSTALTEEELSKCIKTNIYHSIAEDEILGCVGDKDDVKCSICQEEYGIGDELGRLQCEHKYHVVCIRQWLRLKNWCPICKAGAGPSSSSSFPSSSSSSSSSSSASPSPSSSPPSSPSSSSLPS